MQGTKSLTFSMLDWGCQIFHGTRECQKELELFITWIVRHYSVHSTTQPFSCFLVEVKILDNGWHPWSNWLALLPSAPCYRGRGWPSKVKSQNQKSIFKVKSQNQKSNVNLRNKKSIRQIEKSKSNVDFWSAKIELRILTFHFRLSTLTTPPTPLPY